LYTDSVVIKISTKLCRKLLLIPSNYVPFIALMLISFEYALNIPKEKKKTLFRLIEEDG
jgi:hypothetical protein